ncbi:endoplasmic reticulum membrane-associated RNA degradation protein-like [Elysia marginata]|uniref:Endoplasmic reticulum membrane-associated RNA degradation protein-like n=1 Tax=Elysia marginata TaxID=1093978 RepID=A0AAV4GDQ7_9GAST|nr:endoplasmic reticulum membrane-associated RNA degradation protein-like [Elysia marginata]
MIITRSLGFAATRDRVVRAWDLRSGGRGFDSRSCHVAVLLGEQLTLTRLSPPTCKMGTHLQAMLEFVICPGCKTLHMDTNPNYYECCVECLSAIFLQSQDLFATLDDKQFVEKYRSSLQWTQNCSLFVEVFELLEQNDTSFDLLALLSLCGGLERSLGNVKLFLLKGSQVPSTLKDLLATPELFDLLGFVPIQILQIMIGPPISMNIRNVAWHGFFAENELPRRYIYFLLLLTTSIGKHLNNRGISPIASAQRSYISLNMVHNISAHFEEILDEDLSQAEQSICASWIVNKSNKNFFKTAFYLFMNKKYGLSSIMLFPLLEHALRRLYVKVNDCPSRLITAETRTFFTTFEEILDYNLQN